MKRFAPRVGTSAPYATHMLYISESVEDAFKSALADYLALSADFFISGAVVTQTPVGTSTNIAITAGHLMYKGELLPVDAHSVTKLSSQVAFIEVQDDAVDISPVLNLDGETDYVMRRRHARLRVASVYPTTYMALTAPSKGELDRQRLKGRLVAPGMILPYAGSLSYFDGTGLGLVNGPMEGWAVCNGSNGTLDMRGLVPTGATNVPDAGAPTPSANVSGTSDPNELVGSDQVTIDSDNLPEHTHPYTFQAVNFDGGSPVGGGGDGTRATVSANTSANATPNDPISVKQAGRALVFVQSIVV